MAFQAEDVLEDERLRTGTLTVGDGLIINACLRQGMPRVVDQRECARAAATRACLPGQQYLAQQTHNSQ